MTGDDLRTGFESDGLLDLKARSDDLASAKAAKLIGRFAAESLDVMKIPTTVMRYSDAVQAKEAGQAPEPGTLRRIEEPGDVLRRPFQFVLTYRSNKDETMNRIAQTATSRWADVMGDAKSAVGSSSRAKAQLGAAKESDIKRAEDGQRVRMNALREMEGFVASLKSITGDIISDKEMVALFRTPSLNIEKDEAQAIVDGTVDQLDEYAPKTQKTPLQKLTEGPQRERRGLKPREPRKPRKPR